MINCINQSVPAKATSSFLSISDFDSIAIMSSGFGRFDDEVDDANHHSSECLEESYESAKSTAETDIKDERPKPKRPLSAYNWFFHSERQKILEETPIRKEGKPRRSHGKIGFADLARMIAAKWKSLSKEDRASFDAKAAADKDRYLREMDEWKQWQSVNVSQLASPAIDVVRNPMSFMNDPIDSSFTNQNTSFFREPYYSVQAQESPRTDEMKSSDFFSTEPYSLADVFGAQLSRRIQSTSSQTPVPSSQRRTSPTLATLASQLGDESTELFLNLFRDP